MNLYNKRKLKIINKAINTLYNFKRLSELLIKLLRLYAYYLIFSIKT